ncbi:tRNA 2-thiouridine(34) synthase MnmA [Patescibacteria group bacterium]
MKTKNKGKILVGLSGGVDSAVCALLLKKQGFDVVAGFMKNFSFPSDSSFAKYCTWKEDWRSAVRVAAKLDIPFHTFDFQKEYNKYVVDYFFSEYKKGRTPNPDVMCNKLIKFDLFLKAAKKLGIDQIATGHYVRKEEAGDGKFKLLRGIDKSKDQSYFLWTLNQDQIKHSLFPLGLYTKKQVREIAHKAGIPSAHRPDSQGICFIGEIDIPSFVASRLPEKLGEIIYRNKVVGKHKGIQFYTIGQRKGLDNPKLQRNLAKVHKGKDVPALYILEINAKNNQIIIGKEKDLYGKNMIVGDVRWIVGHRPKNNDLLTQIRYQHKAVRVIIEESKDRLKVKFAEPIRAVTPGQSAVFYSGDEMFGGGIIE